MKVRRSADCQSISRQLAREGGACPGPPCYFLVMPASTVNLEALHVVLPTTGPQVLLDAQGVAIDLLVTDDNPNPTSGLEPNDFFVSQGQSGPAELRLPDGSAPDMNAAVLTPYSLVTPPGVIVVG